MPSDKPTKDKHWQVPQAVKDMEPITKRTRKGNALTTWTEAWFKAAIRGQIREIFHRWPRRKEVLDRVRVTEPAFTKTGERAKRDAVWYICDECQAKCKTSVSKANPRGYSRIWVDHKDPVVPIGEDIGFDEFVQRLFCEPSNLQALCTDCHKSKTNKERSERARARTGKGASWRR